MITQLHLLPACGRAARSASIAQAVYSQLLVNNFTSLSNGSQQIWRRQTQQCHKHNGVGSSSGFFVSCVKVGVMFLAEKGR
eukprot:499340-Amphidinium_carterae.1